MKPFIEAKHLGLEFRVNKGSSNMLTASLGKLFVPHATRVLRSRFEKVAALEDISLSLRSGDRLGIMGKNGAGKTCLLKVLAGVYPQSFGELESKGRVLSLLELTSGMKMELSGSENIFLRLTLMGYSGAKREQIKRRAEEFSELGRFLDFPVETYSSGMILRLAFGTIAFSEADILLMDEWLSVGDFDFVEKAAGQMRTLYDNSGIVVIASHNKSLIEAQTKKAIWLESGKIKLEGPTDDVSRAYFAS